MTVQSSPVLTPQREAAAVAAITTLRNMAQEAEQADSVTDDRRCVAMHWRNFRAVIAAALRFGHGNIVLTFRADDRLPEQAASAFSSSASHYEVQAYWKALHAAREVFQSLTASGWLVDCSCQVVYANMFPQAGQAMKAHPAPASK